MPSDEYSHLKLILANFPEVEQKPSEKGNLIIADENVSRYFVRVLDRLACYHKVTSVNHPFRNLGLYKGMDDRELVEIARFNYNAPIITKDLEIGRIYPRTITLPANGHKEKETYILEGLELVFERLCLDGYLDYDKILSEIRRVDAVN